MSGRDILAFYRARLDEIDPDDYHDRTECHLGKLQTFGDCSCKVPELVRRDVAAKRRLLDRILPEVRNMDETIDGEWGYHSFVSDQLLEVLALPYADHADYREEWKP